MGTDNIPVYLKHVIDHAVDDGKMIPIILVFPTYNNTSESDSGNFSFLEKEGYAHDYAALCLCTYNGQCFFWNNGK